MKRLALPLLILLLATILLITFFQSTSGHIRGETATLKKDSVINSSVAIPENIHEIALPAGYKRIASDSTSFAFYLRSIPLRKDSTVYLYNRKPKGRQDLHYAVLDISTGDKDLQQCADAIMRLRAEYFFALKQYDKITFPGNRGTEFKFETYVHGHNMCRTHDCLLKFLEMVYTWCGTYTADAMTKPVVIKSMQPGDIFVKAGAPGHALIVMDVAVNEKINRKIYLLAQSFMPAQDMHIVINPTDPALSPWYEVNDEDKVITPGWIFDKKQLRRF